MIRKLLSILVAIFMFLPNAHGAEMVNVEYIHQYLNTRWGIDLPYKPELTNPRVAANMKYLLTVIDIANEFLNNEQTTDYGNGEYATLAAADTVATNTAIDTLINAPTFTITTTPNTSSFSMIIGAAGNFIIDWGDGKRDVIANKPIGTTTYSHTYSASGEYEIKLTGLATDYSDAKLDIDTGANWVPAFALTDAISGSFMATNVAKISGGLGRMFPTMDDGSNPNFAFAFMMAPITEIPADLFDGISGAPTHAMFFGTFQNTAITSIPANLFGTLNGDGAASMFYRTFYNCANLTTADGPLFSGTITPAERMFYNTFSDTAITSIPANLFGTLNGDGAPSMFEQTFYNCKNLTTADGPLFSGTITPAERMFAETFAYTALTEIPANLFAGIQGAPASRMFAGTFDSTELTEIPADLFAGIQGAPAESMFDWTFAYTALTEIPADLFAGIQGAPASSMFAGTFSYTDITSIPADLFAGIRGAPAESMFEWTFFDSSLTEIPADLFAGIRGAPAENMFYGTFYSTELTEIPADLFAGIQGAPAKDMFGWTFAYTALTEIPANLFAGIQGAPAEYMFAGTFDSTELTEIPANLFAGIRGAPVEYMFDRTFFSTDITSIPENLFAGISGPAATYMFNETFAHCTSLTGPSARTNGQYLYEIWPDVINGMMTYRRATGLSDYDQIPDKWK